jgi:hypothetical protein
MKRFSAVLGNGRNPYSTAVESPTKSPVRSGGDRRLVMVRGTVLVLAGVIFGFCFNAMAVDLGEHRWRHRLLFLIAPNANDPLVKGQLQVLENRSDALMDRDLRVFRLFEHGPSQFENQPLSESHVQKLRAELGVELGAKALILVGKDGGVKWRAPLATDLREIFLRVDAMPMRRAEMREKIKTGQSVTSP